MTNKAIVEGLMASATAPGGVEAVRVFDAAHAPKPSVGETRGRPAKWPFNDLEVGGCFEVPDDRVQSVRTSVYSRNAVVGGKRFTIGKAEDGKWYVWRDPDAHPNEGASPV
jgi:hypothetical protein